MATKSAYRQYTTYPAKTDVQDKAGLPSSRYFQIHFKYMETQMNGTLRSMEATQKQMAVMLACSLLTAELTKKGDK